MSTNLVTISILGLSRHSMMIKMPNRELEHYKPTSANYIVDLRDIISLLLANARHWNQQHFSKVGSYLFTTATTDLEFCCEESQSCCMIFECPYTVAFLNQSDQVSDISRGVGTDLRLGGQKKIFQGTKKFLPKFFSPKEAFPQILGGQLPTRVRRP